MLHTGGTLGMAAEASFVEEELVPGSGGVYPPMKSLAPGRMLGDLLATVPELRELGARLDLEVLLNCDSCRLTPADWAGIARRIDERRVEYDGFIVVTGTDTLAVRRV
jgi:L-asparaginase/Glu-tRNA(Gln) amidotransferase subunit D